MDVDDLLGSTKQFLETDKNIKDDDRKVIDDFVEQCRLRRADLDLVKRYLRNELGLHVHIALAKHVRGRVNAVNLCAVIEHRMKKGVCEVQGTPKGLASIDSGDCGTQTAVFVDVREMGQPSQDFRGADSSRASTVVRLNYPR